MGPKSKDKCHERQKRKDRLAEKTEAETGVMWSQLGKPRPAASHQKLEEVRQCVCSTAGVPSLQTWTRAACQVSGSFSLEIKHTVNITRSNHPQTILINQSMNIGPWYQEGWGPLS